MSASDHDSPTRDGLKASHTSEQIRQRLNTQPPQSYLRDFVYGAIDGAVTTFAVVSGVAGAGLSPTIVIILGGANLVGDGFSMAAGNFLGTRSEQQLLAKLRRMEERHIEAVPQGEREEIRQIFAAQGFAGEDLERVVKVITSDRERWVATMLKEEHGVSPIARSAWKAALMTLVAFLIVGAIPLLPFGFELLAQNSIADPFRWSSIATGIAFFAVGTVKARFVDQHWVSAGLETFSIGAAAAGLAYLVGQWLGQLN